MATHIFAAIDVGSFELELCIYEVSSKNEMQQIDHLRHVIPLGKDTYRTGKISYRLVDEMCRVLGEFSQVMKTYQVETYRAYATSAMREAKNKQIVLDQIRVRTGIQVRIISNSEQRFFSYKAIAMKAVKFQKIIQKGTAIADVSFGSQQISLFDKDRLVTTQNIPMGILKIREILSKIHVDNETEQAIIEDMVDNELYAFKKMYLKDRDIKHLICIGESILYLAKDVLNGRKTDRISAEEFKQFYERLMKMSLYQIEDLFGVNEGYAKLLIPGVIIYKQILEMTGAEMLWVPGIRLCDGIAADYAESVKCLKFTHNFDDDIITASRNMAKRYRCNTSHCACIENYVLAMFDAMKKYHGLGIRERLLLRIATILHDCGKFISLRQSSTCGYDIVMSTEIIGLSHGEREMIANVVRYNIEFFDYDKTDITVAKLTAMLRLANAMDRGHNEKMADCKMSVRENTLVISTAYPGDLSLEIMEVNAKADFFEEIFGIRPLVKQKRKV